MTPEDLLRLARRAEAEATELTSDADRLRAQATALDGSLDPLVPMSQRVWTGPAAQCFENEVRAHAAILAGQAQRLRQIAGEFERRAQRKRQQARELRAQAAALATAVVTGGA